MSVETNAPSVNDGSPWELLDGAVASVSTTHDDLRNIESQLRGLQELLQKHLAGASAGAYQETLAEIAGLMEPRQAAGERLTDACRALRDAVRLLREVNRRESGNTDTHEVIEAELHAVDELVASSLNDFSTQSVDRLREVMTSIRGKVHTYRRAVLASRCAEISAALAYLEQMGAPESASDRFLQSEVYLDLPLQAGMQRLDNELSYLGARATEVRHDQASERAGTARVALASLLERQPRWQDAEQRRLVIGLLSDVAGDPDRSAKGDDLARQVVGAIGSQPLAFRDRFDLWLEAAKTVWRGESSVERLNDVVPTLPQMSAADISEGRRAADTLVFASGWSGEDPNEYWPVLQACLDHRPQWGLALFESLFGQSPGKASLARWLLISADTLPPTSSQLSQLTASASLAERLAIEWWAKSSHDLSVALTEPNALVIDWATRIEPAPSLDTLQVLLQTRPESATFPTNYVLASLAILSERERAFQTAATEQLDRPEYPLLSQFFRAGLSFGIVRLKELVEGTRGESAASRLDKLHALRGPRGGPATITWRSHIFPVLDDIRRRAKSPASRAAALDELHKIRPDRLIDEAIEASDFEGINAPSRTQFREWIDTYRELVPMEVAPASGMPPDAFLPSWLAIVRAELDSLASRGLRGALAAKWTDRAITGGLEQGEHPSEQQFDERAEFLSLLERSGRAATWWRFQCSSGGDWREAAGNDALEQLAGLASLRRAVTEYVRRKLFNVADLAIAQADPLERTELAQFVREGFAQLCDETRGFIASFIVAPLEEQRQHWVLRCSPDLRSDLEMTLQCGRQLLAEVDTAGPLTAEAEALALHPEVEAISTNIKESAAASLVELKLKLEAAIAACLDGTALPDPSPIAGAFRSLVFGDLGTALATLRGQLVEQSDPERPDTWSTPGPARTHRTRSARQVGAADLSRVARTYLADSRTVPSGFELSSASNPLPSESEDDRRRRLLFAAVRLHGDGIPEWRLWLGRWCLEEAYSRAHARELVLAQEHAHDALKLLAVSAERGDSEIQEALVLWLAADLHLGVRLPQQHTDWSTLRTRAGAALLSELVRRYALLRVPDRLAAKVLDAIRIGGDVAPALLGALPPSNQYLHGAVLREVLRSDVDDLGLLSEAIVEILAPWLGEAATSLRPVIETLVAGTLPPESVDAALHSVLGDVPDAIANYFRDEIRRREQFSASRSSLVASAFTVRQRTKTVYLSAAAETGSVDLVIDLHYRSGATPARNLVVALQLRSDALKLTEHVIALPPIRPDDWQELVIPAALKSSHDQTLPGLATLDVLLYRRDASGRDETILKRQWEIKVEGRCSFLNEPTPYVTGKPLSNMDAFRIAFKGRQKELDQIVQEVKGKTQDNFVVVFGQRRIGKSSLLFRLKMDQRIRSTYSPVFLDMEQILRLKTTCAFLQEIGKEIHEQADDANLKAVTPPKELSSDDPIGEFTDYLKLAAGALGGKRRLLLMFDEFQLFFKKLDEAEQSGRSARYDTGLRRELVTSFRYWVQHLPVAFIVAGTRELEKAVIDPSQRLFQLGSALRVGALEDGAARSLVTEPVESFFDVTRRAVDHIVDQTKAHPYLLQNACNKLFSRIKEQQASVATFRDAVAALEELSSDTVVFHHLIGHISDDATRAVLRTLAEVAVDDARGSVDDIVEHLAHRGVSAYSTPAVVEKHLRLLELDDLLLVDRGRKRYRLKPPVLAQHVLAQRDFSLW